ncbi:MAG: DUF4230 domain-containing protein [Candidatus Promineifilaceae bacterium]|nr:DUF4230 domain-containing protein [Candidatus Promineifilaceae bacterium]
MRKVAYFLLIVVFAGCALVTFTLVRAINNAQNTVAPVGDFVRELVIPATPAVVPDPVTIVREVQDLARLETASYSFEKVLRAEREQDLLWGVFGESMLFVAHGEVVAGVDLDKMQEEDVQVVDPDTVMVNLPEAEIFYVVLDNQDSYVADRDTGLLTRADPQLETIVRRRADDELRRAAEESDLLQRANENATDYMRDFLQSLGFEEVIFTDAPPPEQTPYEQEVPKGYQVTPVAP